MAEGDFWNNAEKAQTTVAELKSINSVLKPLDEALGVSADLEALAGFPASGFKSLPDGADEDTVMALSWSFSPVITSKCMV